MKRLFACFLPLALGTAWTVSLSSCSSSSEDTSPAFAAGDHTGGWGGGYSGGDSSTGHSGAAGSSQGFGGAAGAAGQMSADAALPEQDAATPEDAATDAQEPDAEDVDTCAALDPSKPLVLYQSADDSNSMASPVIARRLIHTGMPVPPQILRTYEFLNYYRISYPNPEKGHVNVFPQMAVGDSPAERVLQVGVQSELADSPRRTMSITLVLDTSGSMNGTPMALEKAAALAIANAMKPGDIVSMLEWNDQQSVLIDSLVVSGPNDPTLVSAIQGLAADGSTNLHTALVLGYDLAKKNYQPSRMNRVVLVSDGQANTGVTDNELIAKESHNGDGEGIYLVGVGVGAGVNDTLMNVVTDKGRGAYIYLDSELEAANVFGARFDEVMEVAVRDIRLELTVPWYMQLKTTSAEQSSTNPEEVDPQYLSPSDAIIFHNVFVPCSLQVMNPSDAVIAKATYKRPFTHEPGEDAVTSTIGALLETTGPQLLKGAAIVAYAEALKKGKNAAGEAALQDALGKIAAADPGGTDPELQEIKGLIDKVLTTM